MLWAVRQVGRVSENVGGGCECVGFGVGRGSAETVCKTRNLELRVVVGSLPSCLAALYGIHPSDSVKRHLRGRHLSVLNLKFDFISDGGCTREEQIAHSLKRHLFPHGDREPKGFWICFSRVHPPSEIKSNFKFKTLKRHLLKRHLTLSKPIPSYTRTSPCQTNLVNLGVCAVEHLVSSVVFCCCFYGNKPQSAPKTPV